MPSMGGKDIFYSIRYTIVGSWMCEWPLAGDYPHVRVSQEGLHVSEWDEVQRRDRLKVRVSALQGWKVLGS